MKGCCILAWQRRRRRRRRRRYNSSAKNCVCTNNATLFPRNIPRFPQTHHSQSARVVKGVDLRSTADNCARVHARG
eukprot:4041565-Amphidinium_carterae.1